MAKISPAVQKIIGLGTVFVAIALFAGVGLVASRISSGSSIAPNAPSSQPMAAPKNKAGADKCNNSCSKNQDCVQGKCKYKAVAPKTNETSYNCNSSNCPTSQGFSCVNGACVKKDGSERGSCASENVGSCYNVKKSGTFSCLRANGIDVVYCCPFNQDATSGTCVTKSAPVAKCSGLAIAACSGDCTWFADCNKCANIGQSKLAVCGN